MTCDEARQKLDAYDLSCSPEDLTAIEEHLRACSSCATEALKRFQLKRAIRSAAVSRFVPTPAFRQRIEKRIRAKDRHTVSISWFPALGALAAALLIAVVSFGIWTRNAARELALAELLDQHVATLASTNPVDVVSSDRHTVKPWFQGKVPFTFNLPELENSPYKLIGGKLTYIHDTPAAHLLYELRRHEFSVFILQQGPGLHLPEFRAAFTERGFSFEEWDQIDLRYVVLSDATSSDVHALAELFRSAARQ
jgi:anti-sigma factor RsiW